MRRGLALLAIALLAGLAAWRLLSAPPGSPPVRSRAPVAAAPSGPSVTTAPSSAPREAVSPPPVEPTPAAPVAENRPARVRGTVWGEGGKPRVADIQVGAEQGRATVASARTAADGAFSLEVQAGDWFLCAFAPGWIAWPQSATLLAGGEYEVDLYLERGATVWGWVIGPNASPFPGATVLCADESGQVFGRGKSDANGQYRLTVPAYPCMVCAESEGLAAAVEAIGPAEGQKVRADLRLGQPRRLSGRVVDEEGQPVPGAAIELSREVPSGHLAIHPSWRTETDAQGAFRLDRLPEAIFALSATAPSFLQRWIEGVATGGEELVVVLARGARVMGQVVRKSDGGSVERPVVRAVGFKNQATAEVKAGPDGRFTLTSILPGDYIVVALAKGFAPGQSAPFTVGADGVVEGVRVELSMGGTLRGTVLEEPSRRPVAKAQITVTGLSRPDRASAFLAGMKTPSSAVSGDDGRFELTLLAVGQTTVEVRHESFVRLREEVEVIEGRVTEVTFLVQAGGAVEGLLRASAGGPALATGGRVCLRGERRSIQTHTQPDGKVRLDRLPPGAYRLYAFHEAAGRTAMSFQDVEVRGGETARFEIVPGGAGRLSGQVRPSSGASLTLRRRGVDLMVEIVVETDAGGAYELVGAPSGEYEVRVSGVTETIMLPEGAYDIRRDFDLPLNTGR